MTLTTDFNDEQTWLEVRPAMKAIARKAIFNTLVYEGFDKNADVSVTFTDNKGIRELNKQYRNIDSSTDVLSFPLFEDMSEADDMVIESIPLGDIIISLETAYKQGHDIGHSVYREVAFLCVHSTLHLLGYDHVTSKEDEKDMFRRQKEIMEIMGY